MAGLLSSLRLVAQSLRVFTLCHLDVSVYIAERVSDKLNKSV